MRSCREHKGKKEVPLAEASGFKGHRFCSQCGKWFAMRPVRPARHSGRSFLRGLRRRRRRDDGK